MVEIKKNLFNNIKKEKYKYKFKIVQNITKYRGKNKLSNYDFILFYFIIFITNKYKQVHMKRNYKLKLVHSSYLTKAEIWIHLLIKTRSPYTNDSIPIDQNEIIISKFIIFLKYIFFKIYYFLWLHYFYIL